MFRTNQSSGTKCESKDNKHKQQYEQDKTILKFLKLEVMSRDFLALIFWLGSISFD